MVKLLENTFRAVNIGLVNEIALMCHKMDIGVWEVIDAAKTKPFGFMPFYPGPGLGGHCIPIDPFYLSWKARQNGFECRFIELAGHINASMPHFVVERVGDALNTVRKAVNGARVHVFGVAYKRDVNDMRESPALDVLELLGKRGAVLSYSDPFVPQLRLDDHVLTSVEMSDVLRRLHGFVIGCITRTPRRCIAASAVPGSGCKGGALIYRDGILMTDHNLLLIPVNEIAAVEAYSSATVPAQYNLTGADCGVLLFWTRER